MNLKFQLYLTALYLIFLTNDISWQNLIHFKALTCHGNRKVNSMSTSKA